VVRAEAMGVETKLASRALWVADEIAEWSETQGAILGRGAERVVKSGKDERLDALVAEGDLAAAAGEELAHLRHELGVLVARIEAEALVGGAEAADARLGRTVPVVRGHRGWGSATVRPGLLGRFHASRDLSGPPVHRRSGVVDIQNLSVPGIGRDNWSVRFAGDVNILRDGEYRFVAVVDDGARLRVAGREIIGADAWHEQGATPYEGKIALGAGWHPLELQMYQGSGESKLWLGLAKGAEGPKLIPKERLRHVGDGGSSPAALLSEMARLPKEVLGQADVRLAKDFGTLSRVPPTIAQMAEDAENRALSDLARRHNKAGVRLGATSESAEKTGWSTTELEGAEGDVRPLVAAARQARAILMGQLDKLARERDFGHGRVGALRRVAARIERQARDVPKAARDSAPAEKDSLLRKARTVMKAELDELERATERERGGFSRAARRADAGLAERLSAMRAAHELATEGKEALAKTVEGFEKREKNPDRVRDNITRGLKDFERSLREAQRAEEDVGTGRRAELAARALEESERIDAARERGRLLGEKRAYDDLAEKTAELAAEARRQGQFDTADDLETHLGEDAATLRHEELKGRLAHAVREGRSIEARTPLKFADRMKEQVKRLETRKAAEAAKAGAELEDMPFEMTLASEQLRHKRDPERALAWEQLGRDLDEVLGEPGDVTAEELRPLAERAARIEGKRGSQRAKEEMAKAEERARQEAERDPALAEARRLEDLAKKTERAARERPLRPEVIDELAEMADPEVASPEDEARAAAEDAREFACLAAEARAQAEELERLREEMAKARAEIAEARRRFAEAEKGIAGALEELQEDALSAAAKARQQDLAKALRDLAKSVPEEAGRIAELGKKAEDLARADEGADAARTPEDIARSAEEAKALAKAAAGLADEAARRQALAADELREESADTAAGLAQEVKGRQEQARRLAEAAPKAARDAAHRAADAAGQATDDAAREAALRDMGDQT
ncbi:MAG: PA14 domain-containing protein, partial [Planctomycetota bacterium]